MVLGPERHSFVSFKRQNALKLVGDCTIFWHESVDAVHSTEKTCTYKRVIFVDVKNRRSKNILVL